jgi:MFS family permease
LAVGGVYGGAATYVAEHSPHGRRGFYTSFIQTTATLGLLMSLGIILAIRQGVGESAFDAWGWRVPFLVSIVLVALSIYIRYALRESPLYAELKDKGGVSTNPIKESFGNRHNLKWVLLALFGSTMGQGVIWYTSQFFALFYLQKVFGVSLVDSSIIVAAALVAGTPFFVVSGWLSDRIGRKWIMLSGMLLAVVCYVPLYGLMAAYAPQPVPPAHFQQFLFSYVGYSPWVLGLCVWVQVMFVTMVYGPIAAFLVELFPTKIRYTSMSLPYHIGNGIFGGLVPIVGLALIGATGNNYVGLLYPIVVAAICFAVGAVFIRETNQVDIHAHELRAGAVQQLPQVELDEG